MERTCTFSVFGKARTISKPLPNILEVIHKYAEPGTSLKTYSVHKVHGFWENVSRDLGVPNTCLNRKKIVKAVLQYEKTTSGVEGPLLLTDFPTAETTLGDDFPSISEEDIVAPKSPQAVGNVPLPSRYEDALQKTTESGIHTPDTQSLESDSKSSSSNANAKRNESDESAKVNTDSSSSEDKFFTSGLPQQKTFFFINENEWKELRQHQSGRHFKGLQWTNIIASGIRTLNPYCSFGFRRHSVKKLSSRSKAPVFRCMGYCRFQDCPVTVAVVVYDEETLKAEVVFKGGEVCHNNKELKRRPVRAQARQSAGELLKNKLPRSLYLESLQKVPQKVIQSGNRDDAPTKEVLKNIAWSERKASRADPNELISLQKIIQQYQDTEKDVLQKILMHPKGISMTFCRTSLEDLLQKYYVLLTGQHSAQQFNIPILHRCLSHVMKNAKDLCKKHIPENYRLGMHVFGLLACCDNLKDMDDVVHSAAIVFCSPCSGRNVTKHYNNLKILMQKRGTLDLDEKTVIAEDYKTDVQNAPLKTHFQAIVDNATLDCEGERNIFHAPKFIAGLVNHLLPHATLWSSMMLGDLGRHGTGPAYQRLSKLYDDIQQSKNQNFTQDNRTQGIMEKSQWDLKKIRIQRRRLTRLDDFVEIYQKMHDALLLEYADMKKSRQKSFRVEMEKWKDKRIK
ncbi:uncharacterized protein LOC113032941 [Astatotilapia calliptera]|uniref:uncharacterized protein LOC113032941 n=1 Tax=Astatotilapia calliptera TaxID=8154 RepID=UPI000E417672|nr:uncharacterized protein LOC113032941 [Astatotilapia calliptera]